MKETYSYLLIIIFSLGLSACSLMQRHSTEDSFNENLSASEYESMTYDQRSSYNEKSVLRRLETNLDSEEKRQYQQYKNFLSNDQERIEFLSLKDIYTKNRWLRAKGIQSSFNNFDRDIASLVEQNDITLGMSKQAVLNSWGEPLFQKVAGNPDNENERWIYEIDVPSQEGFQTEKRIVYFFKGRVAGWETH